MSKSINAITDTTSISNIQRIEELEKARAWAAETPCILEFIDCGNLVDLNGCDMSLSREQMNGVLLLLEGVLSNLELIGVIARENGTEDLPISTIDSATDAARDIILLAVKLAKVRLAEGNASDKVCMVKVWVAGFLASLRFANEFHVRNIYECVNELIEAIPAPSEGGDDAKNPRD